MSKTVKRSREEIEKQVPIMKEMFESGYRIAEIAKFFGISQSSVHNSFNVMGLAFNKRNLSIDENNLVYAVNKAPVLEKVIIDGKLYTDITPLFAPR